MKDSLLTFGSVEAQVHAVINTLKEKMVHFGYKDVHCRIESIDLEDFVIQVVGFSFLNEVGEVITPGFFKFPDCFEKPYDTVERFSDLVIHLVSNEIAIRLQKNVRYAYWVDGALYKEETMTTELYAKATLAPHFLLPEHTEDGLYGCMDGLWLLENGVKRQITLFNVCSPDEDIK